MSARASSLLLAFALACACGGKTGSDHPSSQRGASQGTAGDDSGAADSGGTCTSTSLPKYDFSAPPRDGCSAVRAYLECHLPGNGTLDTMSDDPTRMTPYANPDATDCKDLCDPATEYAAYCQTDVPLPGCRDLGFATPAPKATATYCCPCGT